MANNLQYANTINKVAQIVSQIQNMSIKFPS